MVASSIADVGLVETALAVRAGDPRVTVSDAAGLRECLLASDAIFVPDTVASTAGIHVAKVLAQLGIADEVAGRLRIFPNGATAMRELAASDARRPIGCTQSTEIISTKGVMLSGTLPPSCELATMYTAGIATKAAHALAGAGSDRLADRRGTTRTARARGFCERSQVAAFFQEGIYRENRRPQPRTLSPHPQLSGPSAGHAWHLEDP